jgi:Ca2+-binding RTX toxin-like protein
MALKFGTNNSDTIGGTPYGDVIFGGGGNDSLYGFGGNDQLFGEGGAVDTLNGGAGADFLDGGSGDLDTASYFDSPAGVTVNLQSGTGSGGDAEGDILQGIERLVGSDFTDLLIGDDGDNDLYGHAGNDLLNGGGGTDFLFGQEGHDMLKGAGGSDSLWGDEGNDTINGGDGSDWLHGGDGSDHLNGSSLHDHLEGGAGADMLIGGSGEDTFVFNLPGGGSDSIVSNPDHIRDFNATFDMLDMPIAGTAGNYLEAEIGHGVGYAEALNWVESHLSARYVFVTDGVNGYLFGALYDQGVIETGIVLEGLTSLTDFHYWEIVAT